MATASANCASKAKPFLPSFFISGGQTGADSIPFGVYRELGIGLRGYLPRGCVRNDGKGKEVLSMHGLWEGEGECKWRDCANAGMSDALVAFLTDQPKTGRGTMSTANVFVNGRHHFVVLEKPENRGYVVIDREQPFVEGDEGAEHLRGMQTERSQPTGPPQLESRAFPWSFSNPKYPLTYESEKKRLHFTRRPVLVFWDITPRNTDEYAAVLRAFVEKWRPENLMFSGPVETTYPGIEQLGAELLMKTFRPREALPEPPGSGGDQRET